MYLTEPTLMTSRFTLFGIATALVVAGIAAAAWFSLRGGAPASFAGVASTTPATAAADAALGPEQSITSAGQGEKRYADHLTGFSFSFPDDLKASAFGSPYDASGETVLLQGAQSTEGVQVVVTTFDDDTALTPDRIRHDLPQLAMTDVSTKTVGEGSHTAQAVVFSTAGTSMGESRQAWFVYEKRLFQVSAPVAAHDAFTAVIASWQF
jgi:hypothetical protein